MRALSDVAELLVVDAGQMSRKDGEIPGEQPLVGGHVRPRAS